MTNESSVNDEINSAINIALGAILDAQQTAQAMSLWNEKYAGQKSFSVQYFARECCILLQIEAKRSETVKNLIRELYLNLHKLP